jgi:hypothetical protein
VLESWKALQSQKGKNHQPRHEGAPTEYRLYGGVAILGKAVNG